MSYDDMLEDLEPGTSDLYFGKREPEDGLLGNDEDAAGDEDKDKLTKEEDGQVEEEKEEEFY